MVENMGRMVLQTLKYSDDILWRYSPFYWGNAWHDKNQSNLSTMNLFLP